MLSGEGLLWFIGKMNTENSKFRTVLLGQHGDKLKAIFRAILASDPDLAERFITRLEDLAQTELADRDIYLDLRKLYNDNAESFKAARLANKMQRSDTRTEKIVEIMGKDFHPKSYMDIGCGDGLFTNGVTRAYPSAKGHSYATDLAPPISAQQDFEYVSYDEHGQMPVPAGSIDFVTTLMVLHHVPEVRVLLNEIARIMSPAAKFLVRETDATDPEDEAFNVVMDEIFYTAWDQDDILAQHFNFRSRADWCDLFSDCGFEVEAIDESEITTGFSPIWFKLIKAPHI